VKTRILLDHLVDPGLYAPVDISAEHLIRTAEELAAEYPLLKVAPVIADFTKPFDLPKSEFGFGRTCVYFPGSTIGNFTREDAIRLLQKIANQCDPGDGLLIGFDLQKDVQVLEAAYDDREGVTARFNKNVLRRINRELTADFDLEQFDHRAFYNASDCRIEMHLVSRSDQIVTIRDHLFSFRSGESIRTEYSHKYTTDDFVSMACRVGWRRRDCWIDSRGYFAVMYLEKQS
jgi:dimethylhistidine N-methyltransferase